MCSSGKLLQHVCSINLLIQEALQRIVLQPNIRSLLFEQPFIINRDDLAHILIKRKFFWQLYKFSFNSWKYQAEKVYAYKLMFGSKVFS